MDEHNTYVYTPLTTATTFRLLTIRNNDESGTLQFSMSCHEVDDVPVYEAISYTWGDQPADRYLQEMSTGDRLAVTANCEAALRNSNRLTPTGFDSDGHARFFWIDAVCINQNSNDERTQQIGLMDRIYRQAYETNIYLGEPDEHSEAVMSAIRIYRADAFRIDEDLSDVAANLQISRRSYRPDLTRVINSDLDRATLTIKALIATQLEHFRAFFNRPWFYRTWVVQESLLSSSMWLHMGKTMVHLDDIREFRGAMPRLSPSELAAMETQYLQREGVLDLYAAYGFERTRMQYDDAVEQQRGNIAFHQHTEKSRLAAQRPPPTTGFLKYWQLFDVMYRTSALQCSDPRDKVFALLSLFDETTPPELAPDYSLSVAQVYGNVTRYLLRRDVTLALSAARGVKGDAALPTWAVDWRSPPDQDRLLAGELAKDQEWRAGYEIGHRQVVVRPSSDHTLILRGRNLGRIEVVLDHPLGTEGNESVFDFDEEDEDKIMAEGRKEFYLGDDSACLGPAETKAGDCVVVFLGFEVPFVVRKAPDVDGCWQLIGECVAELCMEAEALENLRNEDLDSEDPPLGFDDFHLI